MDDQPQKGTTMKATVEQVIRIIREELMKHRREAAAREVPDAVDMMEGA